VPNADCYISDERPVVVVKNSASRSRITIKYVQQQYGPRVHQIINLLVPILGLCSIKYDSLTFLQAYCVFVVISLTIVLFMTIISAYLSYTAVEKKFGFFLAAWTGFMNTITIVIVAALNISVLVLALEVVSKHLKGEL